MFYRRFPRFFSWLAVGLSLGGLKSYAGSPSTWTGTSSSQIDRGSNWDNGIPFSGIAIFDGNGDHPPLSNKDSGIDFDEIQFISASEISIISSLQTSGVAGVSAAPGVSGIFQVYEHQPLFYPPANLSILSGPAGDGGGSVEYNLESYGQLYAYSGSTGATVVNVSMTGGNNYFEVTGPGNNLFDNISSDSETDQIVIDLGSTLTIRGSDTNTIEGVISGDGALMKAGNGTLILNNINDYTGGTTVSAGVLELNGSVSNLLTVTSGAALKGSGSIDGTLALEGSVSPGNSIGVLTVENLSMASSSVFSCEVDSSGASDQIVATGSMSLAGTLNIIALDTDFPSAKTYSILEAGQGISGTFNQVSSSVPAFKSLRYDPNSLSLTYLPLSAIGLQGNAAAAAGCYVSIEGEDANKVSGELLSLSFSKMQQALNQMQPSQFSAQAWTQISNSLLIRSSYSKHLRDLSFKKDCNHSDSSAFWVDPLGQWEQQGADQNQFGYSDWTAGLSMGTDTSYRKFRFGGAASYTYSKVSLDKSAGESQINSYYGGFYGGWSGDKAYVMLSALGSYNHYHNFRQLSFAHIDRRANSSHHGWEMLTGIEGGASFEAKQCKIGPFARFDYVYLWQQGYQESGAKSLNLSVDSHVDQLIQSQVGLALSRVYECEPGRLSGSFIPRLEASYINQSPINRSDYTASFQNSLCKFEASGWKFERNLGAFGLSLTYLTPSQNIGLSLQYDGQFGSQYVNQSGHFLLNIKY